jgi:catalase (peroxidase I)
MDAVCRLLIVSTLYFGTWAADNATPQLRGKVARQLWMEEVAMAQCPTALYYEGTPFQPYVDVPTAPEYDEALQELDLDAVKADLAKLLTASQDWWPADYGNYGPFFMRLAWHASGSYRKTDGKGGAAGGRQRFNPEASWEDNDNLDKARALLAPIKRKYGIGLSWGDLIVLAGTTAGREMCAPLTTFCAGRVDDPDGSKSLPLGPSPLQQKVAPCAGPKNGLCQDSPNETSLAPTTVGLIYVNPEGVLGEPDPKKSVAEIRTTFEKMGHDDRATVALIGGGHAFGKAHGACSRKDAAGVSPMDAYASTPQKCPWTGGCGTGKGKDTFTSGLEGPWTTTPTLWGNEYFKMLIDHDWEKWMGPGGKWQWRLKNDPSNPRMRLTTDMALLYDKTYRSIAEEFARNLTALDEEFDKAWHHLTHNGGTWSKNKKCDHFTLPATCEHKSDGAPKMLDTDPSLRKYKDFGPER